MKVLTLLLFVFFLAADISAQPSSSLPDAPGVEVGKISWQKDVFVPALFEDPLRPNQERADLVRDQKATIRENVIRTQGGQPPLPLPTAKPADANSERSSTSYRYTAKIKNTGEKTIRNIDWQYLFFDPETGVEVGQHRYRTNVKVRPGKNADLVGRSTTPPVGVVTVTKTSDGLRSKYSERVVIHSIEYTDGTIWNRPAK